MAFLENVRASVGLPCPICASTDWCWLTVDSKDGLIGSICGKGKSAPEGWTQDDRTAKDGRHIYHKGNSKTAHRRKFPKAIEWRKWELPAGPEWKPRPVSESFSRGDRVRFKAGSDLFEFLSYADKGRCKISRNGAVTEVYPDKLELATRDGDDRELEIEYSYTDADGRAVGRIRRRQWTDRRRWYEAGYLKTKEIRPSHSVRGTDPENPWIWKLGRGDQPWPLYRQSAAVEAIDRGEPVFIVAGEPAVEFMTLLGFVATTPQGGEYRQNDVITALGDHLRAAERSGLRPILVLWPDNDPTGKSTWAKLQRTCSNQDILACTLNPVEVWADMPYGGDVAELWRGWTGQVDRIRNAIINAAEQAIDRQERILRADSQRKAWGAPEDHGSELGYTIIKKAPKGSDDPDREVWTPKTDFNFRVTRELIGSDGGGLQLAVKLADYPQERKIHVSSDDTSTKARFQKAIGLGVGRTVICNLKDEQLQALMRVRLLEYRLFEEGMSFRLADRVGRQTDGTWVFRDRQFAKTGEETNESKSGWCWNSSLTDGEVSFKSPTIAAPNQQALPHLANTGRRFFGANWPISLLAMGHVAAALHYEEIMKVEGAFPILNLYGDGGSGKTQCAEAALSMIGGHSQDSLIMAQVSVSAAYERLQGAGGLAHCIDDPKRDDSLSDFFKALYNAKSRVVRGKDGRKFATQTPHSPLFFTSNMALGEDHQAARSRLAKIFVPKLGCNDDAWADFVEAKGQASGCFPDLIKLGFDAGAIKAMEQAIAPHLSQAHDRLPRSFALILHYAQLVANLAGDKTNLLAWCAEHVFPQLNSSAESASSMLDFVQKIWALKTQGDLGAWNVRLVNKLGSRVLAINLPSVWPVVEKAYRLPYDQSNLRSVIEAKGGNLRASHQFDASRNESLACIKDGSKAKKTTQRCVEIPLELLSDADLIFETCENDVNDVDQGYGIAQDYAIPGKKPLTIDVDQTTKDVDRSTSLGDSQLSLDGNVPIPINTINIDQHPDQHDVKSQNLGPESVSKSDQHDQHDQHQKTRSQKKSQKNEFLDKTKKTPTTPVFHVGDTVLVFGSPKTTPPGEVIEIKAGMARVSCSAWASPRWESLDRIRKVEGVRHD
jgi:hypothetical protein